MLVWNYHTLKGVASILIDATALPAGRQALGCGRVESMNKNKWNLSFLPYPATEGL